MTVTRASGGLLFAVVGAAVVALATYQPWYSVSLTPAGASSAQQQLTAVAQQYGSPALQAAARHANAVAGRPVGTVSARQSLRIVNKMLLFLAGLAALLAVLRLAGLLEGNGGTIAFLGLAMALCTLFRLYQPPNPAPGYITMSLSWGGWLSLLGAAAVVMGGLRSPYSRL